MTDPTAPERIWLKTDGPERPFVTQGPLAAPPRIEYVRADLHAAQTAEIARLRAALEWYGEQARLARLIHSEGDEGRQALADDGGKRARAALKEGEE